MKKHRVSTTLPLELYKIATRKNISFTEALEIGVKQKLSLADEKQILLKELERHNRDIEHIMKRLNDIDGMEEYVEEFNLEKVLGIVENLIRKGRSVAYSSIEYWAAELDLLPEQLQKMIQDEYPDVKIESRSRDEIVIDGILGD